MKSFSTWLGQVGHGQLNDKLTHRLAELVRAVCDDEELDGAKPEGSITLKITLRRERDTGAIKAEPDVQLKLPKGALDRSLFFATEEGELIRENPRQGKLFGGETNVEEING